jgi:salicylate hydroxylase
VRTWNFSPLAAVLANLLGKVGDTSDIPWVLDSYERTRKERVGHVIRASLRNGQRWQMPDGPLKDERDRHLLHETLIAGFPNPLADPFFQLWFSGLDVVRAAVEGWDSLLQEHDREGNS